MRQFVLLDLDGTVIDSQPGIVRGLIHALQELGVAHPPADEFTRFIGPPLDYAFRELLQTDDETAVDNAVRLYREYYQSGGIFDCELFEGVRDLIEFIASKQRTLCLVTSKPQPYAEQLLEHFNLRTMFKDVYGATFDPSRAKKTDVLRYALATSGIEPAQAVMIGDRDQDLMAAKDNQTASIGVLWGYGSRDELEGCKPDALAESPQELMTLLA